MPLYGMCTVLIPAAWSNASPAMCCVLPMPDDAYLSEPGCAFAAATSDFTSFAATPSPTTSTFGTTTMSPTGCSCFSGSKLSLSRCGAIAWPVFVATSSV